MIWIAVILLIASSMFILPALFSPDEKRTTQQTDVVDTRQDKNSDAKVIPDYKIYTFNQIFIATYLGGPLAGCYLMSVNFKQFSDERLANKTLLIGIISTAIFFACLLFIPKEILTRIPKYLIPVSYTLIIVFCSKNLQGKNIKQHIEKGGEGYSGWKVIGITIFSLALTVIYALILMVFISDNNL